MNYLREKEDVLKSISLMPDIVVGAEGHHERLVENGEFRAPTITAAEYLRIFTIHKETVKNVKMRSCEGYHGFALNFHNKCCIIMENTKRFVSEKRYV